MKSIMIIYAVKALLAVAGLAFVVITTHEILSDDQKVIDAEYTVLDDEELPTAKTADRKAQ